MIFLRDISIDARRGAFGDNGDLPGSDKRGPRGGLFLLVQPYDDRAVRPDQAEPVVRLGG